MSQYQQLKVTQAAPLELPLVNRFYKQANYGGKAGRGEQAWILRGLSVEAEKLAQPMLLGAVRLQTAQDAWLFLRSFCIHPAHRRQGLGLVLLKALAEPLAGRNSYCFPYEHLLDFYAQLGFERCEPELAPAFIREAYLRYRAQGRKIHLMLRYSSSLKAPQGER